MPPVSITKKTKWECQNCGKCCKGVILSKNKSLSIVVNGSPICKYLNKDNLCTNYNNRPYICRIYPFVVDFSKMIFPGGIARPSIAFSLENLKIHSECPGYGKGKRIYANKNLQKKFKKICYDFSIRLRNAVKKKVDIDEII